MSYSLIGIISILVHLIINRDMLWHYGENTDMTAHKEYREYIFSMLNFCAVDVLWGILYALRVTPLLSAVTDVFFITMMAGFVMWARFISAYMEGQDESIYRKILNIAAIVLFFCEVAILIGNFFIPLQFRFNKAGDYIPGMAQYISLGLQILIYALTFIYTFLVKAPTEKATKQVRLYVGFFGVLMAALIIVQLFLPMLPLYSIGFLLSSCMLHSYIVEEEKDEYRRNLSEMLRRTQEQSLELGNVKRKVYTDPMTGVGSKQAYMEDVKEIDRKISEGTVEEFGIIVFDVNDLKYINDTLGHDSGDAYIYSASMLISEFFNHSPIYRIGGDEFVVILQGDPYQTRKDTLYSFDMQIQNNVRTGKVVISSGMSEYNERYDSCYRDVFDRADMQMYTHKREMKKIQRAFSRETVR